MRVDASVIIVSWNTAELLRACLDSINGSNLEESEVIIVDNGSVDGTADMIRSRQPGCQLICNSVNRGFAAGNNQALGVARGRYALLLNSDTVLLGDVVQKTVQYMDAHPEVGVLGCRVLNPDGTAQQTCFQEPSLLNILLKTTGLFRLPWPRFLSREHMPWWQRDSERDVDVVTGCYMLVRRSALEQVGLLDESFFFCGEETDWCRRFRAAGWKVRFAPVGEIIHYGNASGRKLEFRRDVLLTAGLVRFHHKHGGVWAAAIAWLLLWLFNVTHWIAWRLIAAVTRKPGAEHRAEHFRGVIAGFDTVWRRGSGAQFPVPV